MTTSLTFGKKGDSYVATFSSQGPCVIEMERDKQSLVSVSANLEGMPPIPIGNFQNPYMPSLIFELDLPSGIAVTVKSSTEVRNAKMLTNAESGN